VIPPGSQTATAGQSHSFAPGSFTQSNATGPFNVDVNWGDGSADSEFSQASTGIITAQLHMFTRAATETVSVTITDANGNASEPETFGVTINPAAAAKLAITKGPGATTAGKAISPAVKVAVEDAFGNIVTTNTSTVTIAKNTGPAGATLSGTLAVAAVKGIATFSNLILKTAGRYSLKATDGALAAVTTGTFTINPAAATVTANALGSGTPTGTVRFYNGATLLGSGALDDTGTAIFTTKNGNSGLAAGADAIKAVYGGDAKFQTSTGKFSPVVQKPTRLVIGAVASTVVAGNNICAPTVQVEDALNKVVTADSSSVTIALRGNANGAILGGTLNVPAVRVRSTCPSPVR
jgi:hypothetical protein